MRVEDNNLKTAVIIITSIILVAVVVSAGMLGIVENPSGFLEKLSVTITVKLVEKVWDKMKENIENQ